MTALGRVEPPTAPVRGVTIERTFAGLEARLRPTGLARFFSAAFLGAWLCIWVIGESFALWIIGVGAWSLLTGNPPEPGRDRLALAPSLAVGVFLLAWLAFWTLGGLAALHEFFRLLWSEDRLCVTPGGLEVARRTGIVTRRKCHSREQLRRLYRIDAGPALMADTLEGPVELTRLGGVAQQQQIIATFSAELSLPGPESLRPSLPCDWQELAAPEGGTLLVKRLRTRRVQARVAWLVALPLCAATAVLVHAGVRDPSLIVLALLMTAAAAAASWGAIWLQLGRTEWRIEAGRVIQQQRFGSRVRPRFEATSIILSESRDSDNDAWYAVEIAAPMPPYATPREQRRARRTVLSRIHDSTEPRRLAEWLAMKTGLPLVDRISDPVAKAAEVAMLVRQLEGSGRLGRWAARLIERKTKVR